MRKIVDDVDDEGDDMDTKDEDRIVKDDPQFTLAITRGEVIDCFVFRTRSRLKIGRNTSHMNSYLHIVPHM